MRLRFASLLGLLGACTVAPPTGAPGPITELNGRIARAPVKCLHMNQNEALRTSEQNHNVLIYGSGRTIWLNQLAPGCNFHDSDVLVTEPFGSSLCRGDVVHSFDRLSRIPGPACVLGDFIPYDSGG